MLWNEKYRPKSLSEFVYGEGHKEKIEQIIKNKLIPQPLLIGVQGTGKTTLEKILIKELDIEPDDVKIINASENRSVNIISDVVEPFVKSVSFGEYKVVVLEEMDYLSQTAQASLRTLSEEWINNARFIFTCNYAHKVFPALRSRCQTLEFSKIDKLEIIKRCLFILIKENIQFEPSDVERYVDNYYPDIRKTINELQANSINGVLTPFSNNGSSYDWEEKFVEYLIAGKIRQLRDFVYKNNITEYEYMFKLLYNHIEHSIPFKKDDEKWQNAIVTIADYLYKHEFVGDKEINFNSCLIALNLLIS